MLCGTHLGSSCSMLTSMSSPSKPLIITASPFDVSVHGVFMVVVLSCDELPRPHHKHQRHTLQKICRALTVFFRRNQVGEIIEEQRRAEEEQASRELPRTIGLPCMQSYVRSAMLATRTT